MTREEFFYQCMDIIEHWLNGNRKLSDLRQVTDKLYNEVTKSHWISVEDELPPKDGRYLFYDEFLGPRVSAYYVECTLVKEITHWLPLPQAPTIAKNATVKKGGKNEQKDS